MQQAWRELLAKQTREELQAKKEGVELRQKLVSSENAALAAPSMVLLRTLKYFVNWGNVKVSQAKVNALGLYSGITENLLKCKLEVETALLSLQANSEDKLAVISKIVILLSKLQHQVITFSQDILTTDSTARTGNKLIGGSASLKERRRAVKVEINAKDFIEGNAASSNIEMAQLLENLQKEAQSSPVKSYIRLMLDVPTSSNFAYFYHILIVICILLSMVLLFWQTMVRS